MENIELNNRICALGYHPSPALLERINILHGKSVPDSTIRKAFREMQAEAALARKKAKEEAKAAKVAASTPA